MTVASLSLLSFVLLVLLLACTVQSAFGFGLALVAVPLLSTRLPLALVTPLLALLSMTLGAAIAWRSRAAVRFDLWWRLLASAALGVPLGIAFVVAIDAAAVRIALGTVVLLTAARGLAGERPRERAATIDVEGASRDRASKAIPWTVWPFGIVTGILGGAWNLMGPPLVLFLQGARLDPVAFRATLHAFAFAINAVVVAGWAVAGPPTERGLPGILIFWYLAALVPLLVGGRLGGQLAARVDATRYRRAVHVLLLVTGTALIVTAFD